MKVFTEATELQTYLEPYRKKGLSIGFLPTLGALHDGHMSLLRKAKRKSDITIVSIFVNPTQFNESTDLAKYPRTFDADSELLTKNKCDTLYFPSAEGVYPNGLNDRPDIDLKGLDKVMEGAFRPGHFDGVVQVVKRLLELVNPNHLYMGQKDFQQFSLIQYMIDWFKLPTELVVCPIKREKSGLAMSSRNMRLTPKNKDQAAIIYKTLNYVRKKFKKDSAEECIEYAMNRMSIDGFRPEYFSIVDGRTLLAVKDFDSSDYIVACTAVWAGEIRLIDNKILKKPN